MGNGVKNPEAVLNVWATIALHRTPLSYDQSKATGKSAPWEKPEGEKVGEAYVGGEFGWSPSREDALEIVRMVPDADGFLVPVDEVKKVRTFKGPHLSSESMDYLQVETLGTELLGRAQWGLLRELLLRFYPKSGPLQTEGLIEPNDFDWVMEGYAGKNPARDFHRRSRKLVKWFKEQVGGIE